MFTAKLAALKAKIFVKQNFKKLALLYVKIQLNGLILFAAAATVGMLTGNIHVYRFAMCIAAFCSFIAACKMTERVKNMLFCDFKNKINPAGLCIAGGLYTIAQILTFFNQNQYLTGLIGAIGFLINSVALPFYLYALFTERELKTILNQACRQLQENGIDFFKLLIRFIPLYLLSILISRLPAYYLTGLLIYTGYNVFQISIFTAVITAVVTIIGVIPMYTEIKLYTAIFYLFSDVTE